MSEVSGAINSSVTVYIEEKESIIQSAFKDFVTFSFIAFCVYISQGSTWWTFVTGGMFLMFFIIKFGSIINKSMTTFKSKDKAIEYLNNLKGK